MTDAKNQGETVMRWRDEQDFSCDIEAWPPEGHGRACAPSPATNYALVTQALRDVRHLLPPEGVAIVDAALASMQFGEEGSLFGSSVQSAWIHPFN